ncbi:MAG: hypothetical protein IPM51_15105 [Sphingobacteriaceae bacterium]|nr:hypothetical protein [Sphingobacteriaceae bacterium]
MGKLTGIEELAKIRTKRRKKEEELLQEVNKILISEQFTKKNVLNNLKNYQKLDEVINEDAMDRNRIYKESEIKELAIKYRLKFLNTQCYKFEFPDFIIQECNDLNIKFKKNLKGLKMLCTNSFLKKENETDCCMLFAKTDFGNYYLIGEWGKPFSNKRKYLSWPLKSIENMFVFLMLFTLIVTLILPTNLITLDRTATYWCGYRIGIYFHLLIFFSGFAIYFTFAFSKSISSMYWDKETNF